MAVCGISPGCRVTVSRQTVANCGVLNRKCEFHVVELTYSDSTSTREGGQQRLRSLATLLVEAVKTS
jgi:hypothetical protein